VAAEVAARYYDGRVARPQSVGLWIGPDGIALRGEAVQCRYDWGHLRVSERLRNAPRIIRFDDGAHCEVSDQRLLDGALAAVGYRDPWVARSQRRFAGVIVTTVLLVAGIFAAYRWALPAVADAAARRMPPAMEERLGVQATKIVEQQLPPTQLDAEQAERARRLFEAIVPKDGRTYRLVLRGGGSIGANAFALPGGTVVVTDPLVKLATDDAALQGVLAHEIGHVAHRDLVRQVVSGTVVGAVVTLIAGDVSGVAVALPAALARLSYSRDMEREADAYAVDLLGRKGIAAGPFADLLQRLQAEHAAGAAPDWTRYLQTHPDTAERIEAIRAAAP
jgi:Zn-dependent protease with chaperone function